MNDYLAYSRSKHSAKTFDEERRLFKQFLGHLDPHTNVQNIQPDDIRLYLQ